MLSIVEGMEVDGIINRLFDNMFGMATAHVSGADLRYTFGNVRTNYKTMLKNKTFGAQLLACFTAARKANAALADFVVVRKGLFAEAPIGDTSSAIVQMAIVFCLSAESQIISKMLFVSRNDVDAMISVMKIAFDTARELAADAPDSSTYQALIGLSGALTSHLASVARPLPRMITFDLPISLPVLTLSNRIYYVTDRWEEIVLENKIVHPAFCPREIIGLST